jgi:hypothetical protein
LRRLLNKTIVMIELTKLIKFKIYFVC